MGKLLELIRGVRTKDIEIEEQVLPKSGSPTSLELPDLKLPTPDVAFIAAKAEAFTRGDLSFEQAQNDVAEHHKGKITAVLTKLSEGPEGLEKSKKKRLQDTKSDLQRVEAELSGGSKRVEIDVTSETPKTLPDHWEFMLTAGASVALALWSIYSTHSFLEGSGILAGLPAWGVSIGPIMMAYVIKDALNTVVSDADKRNLRLAYIGIACVAAIAWISTFGHEAGSPVAQLGDLGNMTQAAPDGGSSHLIVRGISQLLVELFGGAILFLKTFELWRRTGANHDVHKVVKTSPQFVAAEAERDVLRNFEHELEHHLGQISKWFEAHTSLTSEFVTKAQAELTHTINVLKGV
jgi:hypothetical protein